MKTVLHWFRRDLRITDNTALQAATRAGDQVVPVYVASSWEGKHRWTGVPRQKFLCGCLKALAGNLDAMGGRLIIRHGQADRVVADLIKETGAAALYYNRDPDPFGRAMEEKVDRAVERQGAKRFAFKDAAIHERDEVLTGEGNPFRVFTPYSKAWAKLDKPSAGGRLRKLATPGNLFSEPIPSLAHWKLEDDDSKIVAPGERAARNRMNAFLRGPVFDYGGRRDTPHGPTTSRLSQDLRFGLLSIRELFHRCQDAMRDVSAGDRKSVQTFINELVWREFYMAILWFYPEVLEHEFNPKYRELDWSYDEDAFRRWCRGETGFPIVDAGMRQLNQTGYMHNRVRMITAMFLTKDLHLDWRWGESYFMQKLVDGEIASNNGGWQWSAGTGADAAPYFRIQNPWTQTQKFDPEGRYIKEWIPELRDVDPAEFCKPPASRLAGQYPEPMVNHAREREVTLRMFKPGD